MKSTAAIRPLCVSSLMLAVLLGAALSLAAQPLQPSMSELLDLHLSWLGGADAFARVRTVTAEGRLEVSGLTGSFRNVQCRDGLSRTEYDLGVLKGATGIGPDSGWVLNASGQLEPIGSVEEKLVRREIGRSFGLHLLGQDGSTREDLGMEDKEGKSFRVIRMTYSDGDRMDHFLDPADGSLSWVRELRDTQTIWHRYEDWRIVDGLRFAFRSSVLHENPTSDQVVSLERVETSAEFDPAAFAPPAGNRKLHRFVDGGTATEWMPITLHRGAYIYLRGTINGVETEMLLDSGAGMTVLDKAFAESIGVASAGEVTARGTSGESTASIAQEINLQVGTLELSGISAAVIDLSHISSRIGRPMPVIFGKEVFHALVVDVDYPGSRIRFLESEGFTYEGPGKRLGLFPAEGGHKQLEISVEGLSPARVTLDTGSGAALDLFGPYVDENRLLENRQTVSEALTGGVGGVVVQKVTSLSEIEIAGYTLKDVPVGIARTEAGAFDTRRSAGNLGAGILKRFRVFFDYARSCLWLEPTEATLAEPFTRERSGLQVGREGDALQVYFVAPGSPAAGGDWKVGERIVAVDGQPVGTEYREEIDRFGTRPAGSVIRLTLADGAERTITLARYY